ncbi:unnamed protein product [Caenorhabditis bovis]|uniref:Uncharacterized protein n=1 Tax=Caenorhabditis bovis TaxID=2654633 RepID=A0A8S1F6A4_9PELO|nr:unnamed protein product [Caenorhabditis bovis]
MYVSKRSSCSSLDTLISRCFSFACFGFGALMLMNRSVVDRFAITPNEHDKYVCFFTFVYFPPANGQHERQALGSAFPERALDLLDLSVNRINVARMVYDERNFVHRRRRKRRIENQSDDGGEKKEISVKIPYLSIYTIAFLVLYISTGVLLFRFCKRLYKHKILRDPMSRNAIRRFPQ